MSIRQRIAERRAQKAMDLLIKHHGGRVMSSVDAIRHHHEIKVDATDLFTTPSPALTDDDGMPTRYAMSEIVSVEENDRELASASSAHRAYALRNTPTDRQVAEAAARIRAGAYDSPRSH